MPDLMIAAYESEHQAEAARRRLFELRRGDRLDVVDAVVAVREADGTVRLNQLVHVTAQGAIPAGMWGALVGMIFLNPLLAAAEAGDSGALSDHLADAGIHDAFLSEAASALRPGHAALCVMVHDAIAERLLPEMARPARTVLRTSLTLAQERRLRAAIGQD
jgi:uncharacterized membrane protein